MSVPAETPQKGAVAEEEYLSDASEDIWKPSVELHPSVHVPVAFKIYTRKIFSGTKLFLGHERTRPLNAISGHNTSVVESGELKLHQGPGPDSPVLGSSRIRNKTIEIILPSSSSGVHVCHESDVSFWKKLKSSGTEYYFDLETPRGSERFEWRRSKGPEVEALHNRGTHGWVLLRDGHDGQEDECVAACGMDAVSLKLAGKFAFVNSGLTSELGADFVLMAILSALSLIYKRREAYVVGSVLINSKGD